MPAVLSTRLRLLLWHPEWPFAIVILIAWLVLSLGVGSVHAHDHHDLIAENAQVDHHHHLAQQGTPAAAASAGLDTFAALLGALGMATVMSLAMMLPVTLPAVQHVAVNSLRVRRNRAMIAYVGVYLGIWVGVSGILIAADFMLRDMFELDGRWLFAAVLGAAAAWQLSPFKRRALGRCKRTVPLPPIGLRADAGCARFALAHGTRCVVSCWALMAVMVSLHGHVVLVMIVMTAYIAFEELTKLGRQMVAPAAIVLAISAGLVAVGL